MLNINHNSASKLPWSMEYLFFIVLTMGAAHCSELPNEQPRSNDSFPKTAYLISNKMGNLKQNVISRSKSHRPFCSLEISSQKWYLHFGVWSFQITFEIWLLDCSSPFLLKSTTFLLLMQNSVCQITDKWHWITEVSY